VDWIPQKLPAMVYAQDFLLNIYYFIELLYPVVFPLLKVYCS
jgi:hypothetical protein